MKSHYFSFGEIHIIQNNIAELIINEGEEIDRETLKTVNLFLVKHMPSKFSLLVDKKHHYSYSLDAQQHLFDIKEVHAIAIVIHSKISKISMESAMKIAEKRNAIIQIFQTKKEAIIWLQKGLDS